VTIVEVLNIEEAGRDFLRLRLGAKHVQINFADDELFSKEESASFFHGLQGKPVAVPLHGPFFLAVDLWLDRLDGSLKVIPFNFTVASVERS
jgi:hypothetical protein